MQVQEQSNQSKVHGLTASGLIRYVRAAPWSVIMNAGVVFKAVEISLGYQWDSAFSTSLFFDKGSFFSFGYAYQIPSPKLLRSSTTGIHEFIIKIRLNVSKNKEEKSLEEPSSNKNNQPLIMNK